MCHYFKIIWEGPRLCAALFFCLLMFGVAFAVEVPSLKSRVNDTASMLSPGTRRQLENSLAAFEASDSTQIVVLTVPSLEGEPIEDFSIRVADTWKIGQKGLDNGAILLIAKSDRKLRIEVGYGLEGTLTDLISGRIIQQIMVPQFRNGNFDQGVINGVNAMMEAVKGEFKAPARNGRPTGKGPSIENLFVMAILFIFCVIQLGRISRALGAVAGGVMLPLLSGILLTTSLLVLAALIPAGLLLGYILSLRVSTLGASTMGHRRGSRGGYWGGYWGGSGGGFSSGGFGGFSGGGGGFGGGGASGGW